MKIQSLYIPDFLILKDFKIQFDTNQDFAIIIGDNGSGKSTLLEVVAYIFGHLHKYFVLNDKTAEFIDGYEIEFISNYKSQDYKIFLKSIYVKQKTNTFKPLIKVNDVEMSLSQIEKEFGGFANFLPSRIGVYYAGEAKFLQILSEHFEKKFITELIKKDNPFSLMPLNLPKERPFYYIKDEYLGIILLALLSKCQHEKEILNLLKKLIGDFDVNDVVTKIILKKPDWATTESGELWGINSKFVSQFVTKLNENSSKVETDEKNEKISYWYFGLIDIIQLFEDSKELDFPFVIFDTLLYNGILDKIEVVFKMSSGIEIESERLSEGQRQFIVTSGLSALWKDRENKLFLYDEPDVFLHPRWQREFIPFLRSYFNNSFALLTTHNPALLSDVNREQVILFRNGKIINKTFRTLGKEYDRLLVDYFGLEHTRSIEASKLFESLHNQIRENSQDKESFKINFAKLQEMVGKDDKDLLMLNFAFRKANEKN